MLSEQARRILLARCANHTVAHCVRCGKEWFREEVREEIPGSGGQGVLCPSCGADLTSAIQQHLFGCLLRRVFRDDPQLSPSGDATIRQRFDSTDHEKPRMTANDQTQLVATLADTEPGALLAPDVDRMKPACGGARRWLIPAGVVVSGAGVLAGVVICKPPWRPRSESPTAVASHAADVADSPGLSRTAPPMGSPVAEDPRVPPRTDSMAMSAPRDVVPPPSRHRTAFADPVPQVPAPSRGIIPHRARSTSRLDTVMTWVRREWDTATTEVRTVLAADEGSVSKPGQRSAVTTLRNQPVARTSGEQIQSP